MRRSVFRRASANIRRQDWTAVLIDLMIVVVGVFLGIQAANWNQARHDRAEERRYYTQISDDLRTDLDMLDRATERSRANDLAAERALAIVGGTVTPAPGKAGWARDFVQGGFLFLPRPARGTYDELISTGNLGLLRDSEAKRAISSYYAGWDELRQWDQLLRGQQQDYWRAISGLLPRRVAQSLFSRDEPSLTPAEYSAILNRVRTQPDIGRILTSMASHQARVRRDAAVQRREALVLIARLEPLSR